MNKYPSLVWPMELTEWIYVLGSPLVLIVILWLTCCPNHTWQKWLMGYIIFVLCAYSYLCIERYKDRVLYKYNTSYQND